MFREMGFKSMVSESWWFCWDLQVDVDDKHVNVAKKSFQSSDVMFESGEDTPKI